MMLIAIVYLACAAYVLTHLGNAPHVEDDGFPGDTTRDAPDREPRDEGAPAPHEGENDGARPDLPWSRTRAGR